MAPSAELCDPVAARAAFEALSAEGAAAAPELRLERGAQILREDALVVLERALGRPLALEELVAAESTFALDAGAVLGRAEFEAALGAAGAALARGGAAAPAPASPATRSLARLLAMRRRGLAPAAPPAGAAPRTSAAEVGWRAAAAPPGSMTALGRRAPLRGTDVTRGGEGHSLASYFGPELGRCL
jgi:hypothetical protein